MNNNNTIFLVEATWQDTKTFKLLPISSDCPYVECIFDPSSKVFVIISKVTKSSLHMLPKLDEYGKAVSGVKGAKQHRTSIDTFQEYYIEDAKSIKEILNIFATNVKTFNFSKYLDKVSEKPSVTAVM